MARIAFFSPLPPNPSGIADYAAELLPGLARHHDISLCYDRESPPSRDFLPELPRFRHDEYAWRARKDPFDLNIYQMGNSLHHKYIFPFVFQYAGLLVLHEIVVHHARGGFLAQTGRANQYSAELEYCHPGLGRAIAETLTFVPSEWTCFQLPMNKLMVDCSLAVAAHTSYGVNELKAQSPRTPAVLIKFPRYRETPPQGALLDRYRLRNAWPVLGCFGSIKSEKRIESCLEAVSLLISRFPRIHCVLVGAHPKQFDPHALVKKYRLKGRVTITGPVRPEVFNALFHAVTIVLNLRYPSAREMSATLVQALGAGRVALVSDLLHLSDFPPAIAPRVPLFDEAQGIARIVKELLADPVDFEARGRRAREFMDTHHSLDRSVESYDAAIAAAIDAKRTFAFPANVPAHVRPLAHWMESSLPKGLAWDLDFCRRQG
ncbi:MAG: glycosyltransferase family 4 protein [Acidobacteriota bacterium]